MPNPKSVNAIVIHCSAGFGDVEANKRYWKSLGWNSPGYHLMIDTAGTVHQLAPFQDNTNGVKGHNSKSLHICYIGGVEKLPGGKFKAKDTRTAAQKKAIIDSIHTMQCWLKRSGVDTSKVVIKGHRDFSPDKNLNGMIDAHERIKECPSFDAIPQYKQYQK